jgi:short-subunit dehydrogenase involved in D-alanine esterification of teichoic acids
MAKWLLFLSTSQTRIAVAKLGALYPDVNLVINNAGYFGMVSSTLDSEASESAMKEVEVDYIAPLRIVQSFSHES